MPNRALEFHNSTFDRLESDGANPTLCFSAAHIHESYGDPSLEAGSGWTQEARFHIEPAFSLVGGVGELSCAHDMGLRRTPCVQPWFRMLPTALVVFLALSAPALFAQVGIPEWCRALPRPEYKTLQRMPVSDPWFEAYKVAPAVFAIYEPHQYEETISYLIVGDKQALLFDTGMGISDLRKVTAELTQLPIIVLNSHTHDDHVGDNWQFKTIYGMNTDFTRENARGSRQDAQAELAADQICGNLPKGFDPKAYETRPWKITAYVHDGDRIDLGGRSLEITATPGHTPDAISLLDRANGLLFTGDTYYPATIWLYRPETDVEAYAASIRRLAALAPQIKMVLGAHNIPVAAPSVLPRLVTAFETVRAGKVPPTPADPGQVIYQVGDISFRMRAAESKR
jgi:glyoxylase-like metal-dependent hydrolase (beta-lactamase superfamily II)